MGSLKSLMVSFDCDWGWPMRAAKKFTSYVATSQAECWNIEDPPEEDWV